MDALSLNSKIECFEKSVWNNHLSVEICRTGFIPVNGVGTINVLLKFISQNLQLPKYLSLAPNGRFFTRRCAVAGWLEAFESMRTSKSFATIRKRLSLVLASCTCKVQFIFVMNILLQFFIAVLLLCFPLKTPFQVSFLN